MTIFAIITIFTGMMKKTISLLSIALVLTLAGCSHFSSAEKVSSEESKSEYPKAPADVRRARAGSFFGDGGFKLFSGRSGDSSSSISSDIAINSYLWRSALDTVSFMPLASADPFGGVIITDWYEDPAAKGERFKANVLILSKNLRSDAIRVSVFKQAYSGGSWRDSKVNDKVARELENKILTRARELRIEKENR